MNYQKLPRYFAFFVIATLVTGACFQAVMVQVDKARYPAPGTLIEVNGHDVHVVKEGVGRTVVLLDAGMGQWSEHWEKVQSAASKYATVIAYDRPGFGWSEAAGVHTGFQVADHIAATLDALGIDEPIIYVGHSLGATFGRAFVVRYPDRVSGLIVVDNVLDALDVEGLKARFPDKVAEYEHHEKLVDGSFLWVELDSYLQWFGIPRVGSLIFGLDDKRSAGMRLSLNGYDRRPTLIGYRDNFADTYRQIVAEEDLSELPVTVIAAGDNPFPMHKLLMREQAALSVNSKYMVAEKSGHLVPQDQPEIIVEAIRDMLVMASEAVAAAE